MRNEWIEVGDRVFVRRHQRYKVNAGLIVGDGACLVIDTRESLEAGQELADAVRTVTDAPWAVVNTHAHFDHFLGNAAFVPASIWALEECLAEIERSGVEQRDGNGYADTPLVTPTDTFATSTTLHLGGRTVALDFFGRGHTNHDLVVSVDDVVFAGDLVEEGDPPGMHDGYPAEWPDTIEAMLQICSGPIVPGHGAVVDADFVREQQVLLRSVAHLSREEATARING